MYILQHYLYRQHKTTPKKIMGVDLSDIQYMIKMDKNQTHLLPVMSNTLNMLRHEQIFIGEQHLK